MRLSLFHRYGRCPWTGERTLSSGSDILPCLSSPSARVFSYAAKVSLVPDMFRMNCPGISFSMCRMALRPVQCVGTT